MLSRALLMQAELLSLLVAMQTLHAYIHHRSCRISYCFAWPPRGQLAPFCAVLLAALPSIAAWQPGRPKGNSLSSILRVRAGTKPAV